MGGKKSKPIVVVNKKPEDDRFLIVIDEDKKLENDQLLIAVKQSLIVADEDKKLDDAQLLAAIEQSLKDQREKEEDLKSYLGAASEMLKLIDPKRGSNDLDRLDIGRGCYDAALATSIVNSKYLSKDEALVKGFKIWTAYIRTEEKNLKEEWEKFRKCRITLMTLIWYAKLDTPEVYEVWRRHRVAWRLEQAVITGTDEDIAMAIYTCYHTDFSFCNGKWYHYKNNRWVEGKKDRKLREVISSEFATEFKSVVRKMKDSVSTKELAKLNKLVRSLESATKKKRNIMIACQEHFEVPDFDKIKDADGKLFGVRNGVIDLRIKNEAQFRAGKPEDYLTKSTTIKYDTELTLESQEVKDVMLWFSQAFTAVDKELQYYVQRYIGSALCAGNTDKKLLIWIGDDDTKSMLLKLLLKVFGSDYFKELDSAVVTQKKKSSNRRLAWCDKARLVVIQGEDDTPFVTSTIKKLTNGTSITVRDSRKEDVEMEVTFKLLIYANHAPIFTSTDETLKARVELIPCLSTRMTESKEQCFKMDTNFDEKVNKMAKAMLWLMCNHWYPRYCTEGLIQPEIVKQHTKEYWDRSESYIRFDTEEVEIKDTKDCITLDELFDSFTKWYRQVMTESVAPDRNTVIRNFICLWGKPNTGRWYGRRLKEEKEQFDEDEPGKQVVQEPSKSFKCIHILERGARVGEACGAGAKFDGYCKRHYIIKQTRKVKEDM